MTTPSQNELKEVLIDAGYELGHDADEVIITRAIEEFAEDVGVSVQELTLVEIFEKLQKQAELKQAVENNFFGEDVTFIGDISFAQEVPSLQQALTRIAPQPGVQPTVQPTVQTSFAPNQLG